jgi:hypothetical protein
MDSIASKNRFHLVSPTNNFVNAFNRLASFEGENSFVFITMPPEVSCQEASVQRSYFKK